MTRDTLPDRDLARLLDEQIDAMQSVLTSLEAERQAAATNARVERTARERLAMRTATPAVTIYVPDVSASGVTQ